MTTFSYTQTLEVVSCTCGISFGIPAELHNQMHDNGKSVYCPLGHSWHYTETTEQKLKKEREAREAVERRLRATRDLLAQEERSHAATRGHLTRQRKRAAHGVCPCCNRQFQNVRRHMKSKHPDYIEAAGT